MIPKLSAPLVKDIRTGEGILEWALALLDTVAGVTGNLSMSHTVLYGTILAGSKSVRRLLLKAVAAQQGLGIGTPLEPAVLGQVGAFEPVAVRSVEAILAEIDNVEAAAKVVQARPGTPAAEVVAGLAPEPAGSTPPTA